MGTHVIFCKGLLGDHLQPPLIGKKTSIMVFLCGLRSQLRDFAEQSINRDHVGRPWSWQFDKTSDFFRLVKSVNWSWGLGRDAVSFQATGHVGHVCVTCRVWCCQVWWTKLVCELTMTFRGCGWPSAAREAFWVHFSWHQAFFNFSSLLVWLIVVVCSFLSSLTGASLSRSTRFWFMLLW